MSVATQDGQAEDAVLPADSSVSQNGWPASPSPDAIGIHTYPVPDSPVSLPVKSGDVATVLMYVADRFDVEVETLRSDSYGYSYRYISGTNVLSNHASGTAIDLNAGEHPQGHRDTFSSAQEAVIRDILAVCQGVVRWGGDYTSTVDEMHFEINVLPGDPLLGQVALSIQAGEDDVGDNMRLFTSFKQIGRASIITLDFAGRFVHVRPDTYDLLVRKNWISPVEQLTADEIDLIVGQYPRQAGSLTAEQIKSLP